MQHFEGITELDAIKLRYKELAKLHHPDLGGDVETMKLINVQYDQVLTGVYQKSGKTSIEIDELLKDAHEVRAKLYEIATISGINIEICGSWIWITGLTKLVKDTLKGAGFFWSPRKTAWYWRKESPIKTFNRGNWDLEKIRSVHGSNSFKDSSKKSALI